MTAQFPGGICFVALSAVSDPAFIYSTIAQALGLRDATNQAPQESLQDFVARLDQPMLILLDNFEHLVAAAPVIAQLLMTAPNQHRHGHQPGAAARLRRARISCSAVGAAGLEIHSSHRPSVAPSIHHAFRRAREGRQARLCAVSGKCGSGRGHLRPARRPAPSHRTRSGTNQATAAGGNVSQAREPAKFADRWRAGSANSAKNAAQHRGLELRPTQFRGADSFSQTRCVRWWLLARSNRGRLRHSRRSRPGFARRHVVDGRQKSGPAGGASRRGGPLRHALHTARICFGETHRERR